MAEEKYNNVNGLLLFNKPLGLSSNIALQKVKRIFKAAKAGHTGTLDPLASGLLPICFGEATKFSSFLLDGNKEYIATIKLGITTTTYDAEGDIVTQTPVTTNNMEILTTVKKFVGKQMQTPPIYSAIKLNGKALYEYARSGVQIEGEVKSREIEIFEIDMLELLDKNSFVIRILCSKGTYIRSLAYDIGITLGCGAHLTGLKRSKSNHFVLNEQLTLDHLQDLNQPELTSLLLPIDSLLPEIARLDIGEAQFAKVKFGNQFEYNNNEYDLNQQMKLYYRDKFLGVAKVINGSKIQPVRLINQVL